MIQAVVLDNKHGDEYAVIAYPVPVDALKFFRITQVLPHAHGAMQFLVMSRSEPFAAFGAAPFEHEAAVFAGHARAKTVGLRPSSIIRLKSALRHSDESPRKTK